MLLHHEAAPSPLPLAIGPALNVRNCEEGRGPETVRIKLPVTQDVLRVDDVTDIFFPKLIVGAVVILLFSKIQFTIRFSGAIDSHVLPVHFETPQGKMHPSPSVQITSFALVGAVTCAALGVRHRMHTKSAQHHSVCITCIK